MLFKSMLLVYLYCLGARRRQWMPFGPPFATTGELFIKNTSISTSELFTQFI